MIRLVLLTTQMEILGLTKYCNVLRRTSTARISHVMQAVDGALSEVEECHPRPPVAEQHGGGLGQEAALHRHAVLLPGVTIL